MSRNFAKNWLILLGFLLSVCVSSQLNVNPKVEFVEDNNSEHVPPKIQGVRVILDTTKMNDAKNDDKTETIRIQTDGAKQTVGIHTDITFEIGDKKNKSTAGINAESSEDDDEEVPIYRGTNSEHDRSSYDRRFDPNGYRLNQANFHGTNDAENVKYANAGTWIRFLPSANGEWTTERYSADGFNKLKNRGFQSGFVSYGIGQKSMQPCICEPPPSWRDRDVSFRPINRRTIGVDDKLEYPFSESD